MRVTGDGRDSKGIAQHDIRGLSADARQGRELLHRARDLAAEVLDDLARGPLDADGFVVVEAAGADVLLDLFQIRVGPIGGGFIFPEQLRRDHVDPDIRALGRENRRDQQFQRVGEMQRDSGIGVGLLQDRQNLLDPLGRGGLIEDLRLAGVPLDRLGCLGGFFLPCHVFPSPVAF